MGTFIEELGRKDYQALKTHEEDANNEVIFQSYQFYDENFFIQILGSKSNENLSGERPPVKKSRRCDSSIEANNLPHLTLFK